MKTEIYRTMDLAVWITTIRNTPFSACVPALAEPSFDSLGWNDDNASSKERSKVCDNQHTFGMTFSQHRSIVFLLNESKL